MRSFITGFGIVIVCIVSFMTMYTAPWSKVSAQETVECPAAVVDEEGFTLEEPLENALCKNGTYALFQRQRNEACELEYKFIRECDGPIVVNTYEPDDPALPEPIPDPHKTCEVYTDLEVGCP